MTTWTIGIMLVFAYLGQCCTWLRMVSRPYAGILAHRLDSPTQGKQKANKSRLCGFYLYTSRESECYRYLLYSILWILITVLET